MSASFHFRAPAHVTLGSVGPPGQRVFYLQAREEGRLVSLKLEKQQVAFLAGGLREVMADLASPSAPAPETRPELEQPVEEEWAVGALELAYDPTADRIVLVASEVGDEEDQDEEAAPAGAEEIAGAGPEAVSGAIARFEITREQAVAMIETGKQLLRSGRPPCPLCGFPLTADHSCPKTNGHRAPSL